MAAFILSSVRLFPRCSISSTCASKMASNSIFFHRVLSGQPWRWDYIPSQNLLPWTLRPRSCITTFCLWYNALRRKTCSCLSSDDACQGWAHRCNFRIVRSCRLCLISLLFLANCLEVSTSLYSQFWENKEKIKSLIFSLNPVFSDVFRESNGKAEAFWYGVL